MQQQSEQMADDSDIPSLPPTAWAVLGLLSFGAELSGYEVKKWADRSLGYFYWSPAMSQIYRELRRLEEVGFAISKASPQDELRNKRVYAITPAGLEAVRRWQAFAPVELPAVKNGTVLRVWLGHLGDLDQVMRLVEQHIADCDRLIPKIEVARTIAEGQVGMEFPAITHRWSERFWTMERDLSQEMLRDLQELKAKRDGS